MEQPLWYQYGLKDLGFHELGENRGIERFIAQAKCGEIGDPWCAIWTNAKLEQAGVKGTRSASSQSFRHSEDFVRLTGPVIGAIAVYWRKHKDSVIGHVGFYAGETSMQVLTLGGNESDAVRKQFEPKLKLYGYWWPKSVPTPSPQIVHVSAVDGHPTGSVT